MNKNSNTIQKYNEYLKNHKKSLSEPNDYWTSESKSISWFTPFKTVSNGDFSKGEVKWFQGGKLNASYNCIDRHLGKKANDVAIIWEGDDEEVVKISFSELKGKVCKLANLLRKEGVKKGDVVCIYMPMIPEAAIAMLACTRIGALHSVVFAGFSAVALAERISHSECKVIITADEVFLHF